MLSLSPAVKLWYCPTPVDMRLGFDGLHALVGSLLKADPRSGHLFIFRNREFGAKEEIAQGVFVEHAMHDDAFLHALEINPVILGPIAQELFAFPLQHAKAGRVEIIQVVGKHFELSKEIQLQILGEGGHFPGAQFIEDNLKHGESGNGCRCHSWQGVQFPTTTRSTRRPRPVKISHGIVPAFLASSAAVTCWSAWRPRSTTSSPG